MEPKKDFSQFLHQDILDNISKIYNHEKQINEKIIEVHRTNANLLR